MTTSNHPSVRVDAERRQATVSVLHDGETLTSLIESAILETMHRRQAQTEFLARGLRSSDAARRTGTCHDAAPVHTELQRRLDARCKQVLGLMPSS